MRRPVNGYNHDIPYRGVVYHVQTEFLERPSPHVGTQIYCGGRVLEAAKSRIDEAELRSESLIANSVKTQHKAMIRRLLTGQVLLEGQDSAPDAHLPAASHELARGPALPRERDGRIATDLELRRSAILVTRAVRRREPPSGSEVRQRLSSIMTSLAVIAGRHSHDRSRHDELAELLMLRSEGLEWLRSRDSPLDAGRRLWERFARIATTLSRINDRDELVSHDLETWSRVHRELGEAGDDDRVEARHLESLRDAWGRDPALDHLVDFPNGLRVGALRRTLESAERAVRESLGASAATSSRASRDETTQRRA